jgi:ketosteroid isomerase-like protein
MVFTSFTSPIKQLPGKRAYLQATKRFYSMILNVDVREQIVDGERACVQTRYRLKPPSGDVFASDVAEIFAVKDGKIQSLSIYFDTSPFPK